MKNKNTSDVVVVGGGPIGIHTAIRLADSGIDVTIIEDDAVIGKPRWCTGLISEDVFEKFDISKSSLQRRVSSARVVSPFGSEMKFNNDKMQVCVIDRTKFDQELYKEAKERGVKFLLNSHCLDIKIGESCAELFIKSKGEHFVIRTKLCVLATGIKYALHNKLNLGLPDHFLDSIQSEFRTTDVNGVEVYLGSVFAPKSFAWVVPVEPGLSRIGVSSDANSYSYLMKLLDSSYLKDRATKTSKLRIVKRPIPVGTIRKTFSSRLLVVGDAAGQVKPISGGGIYYGLLASNIASDVIIEAFKQKRFDESFLSIYETKWKKKIGFELTIGLWMRNSFSNCTDEQIDSLVQLCSQPNILRIFEKYDYFNKHGKLFNTLVKKPTFWSTIYKMYRILSGENSSQNNIEDIIKNNKYNKEDFVHEDSNIAR